MAEGLEDLLTRDLATYDPYDLWRTTLGLQLKRIYYSKGKIAVPLIAPFSLLDAYAPRLVRVFVKPQEYPTVRAFAALAALNLYMSTHKDKYLDLASECVRWLIQNQSEGYHGACWGLNFPWMTKTGYCPPSTPFITSTPYCVEALLNFADLTGDRQSLAVAMSSLNFMENDLQVLYHDGDRMALSYGPYMSGRIVVNASSYAMMLYALLAERYPDKRTALLEKAHRLFNFLKSSQNEDGSWFYYFDGKDGNFIDCFHSCFILKNLLKYRKLAQVDASRVVEKGFHYILSNFIDGRSGLAKRFTFSANPGLVKFDLYDQAELLHVLCISGRLDSARELHDSIMRHFYIPSKKSFGSQIDVFGILNRMTYLRWAVMPAVYALSEYYRQLEADSPLPSNSG